MMTESKWNGHGTLIFHGSNGVSVIVPISQRCSDIFIQAQKEFEPLNTRYDILFTRTEKLYSHFIQESGWGEKDIQQAIDFSPTSDSDPNQLCFSWNDLRSNMEHFCMVYLGFYPPESIIGPFLKSQNQDAQWCSTHIVTISEAINELLHNYRIEEEAHKAARYSKMGLSIGCMGAILTFLSMFLLS